MSIKENLNNIKNQIAQAEIKAGRTAGSVKLMAVSKFNPSEAVIEAINSNHFLFGENRVQEATEKFTPILADNPEVKLHMIGSLQTNKVKNIVNIADCIESVDRIDLLKEIEKQCSKIDKKMNILIEYHTGEESKAGFESEQEVEKALQMISDGVFPHIIPQGFMTMAPFTENKEIIRNSFRTLRLLSEKMQKKFPEFHLSELSMGMSGDFEIAIEEGSTLVRVGTAIFGARDYSK